MTDENLIIEISFCHLTYKTFQNATLRYCNVKSTVDLERKLPIFAATLPIINCHVKILNS